jgi:HlyD family secretion protein
VALEREAATRVVQTKAASAQAARAAERRRALLEVGGVARESVEQYELEARLRAEAAEAAQAAHEAARADVAAARAVLVGAEARDLPLVAVRAPAAGRVLRVPDRSGRIVAAGAPLLELGDAHALEVVVPVLSSDAVKVLPGACAELLEWGGAEPLEGTVREVEPSAFTRVSALGIEEQRVNVVIDVAAPPPTLGDNYRVEARIVVWEAEDVLLAPSSALGQEAGEWIAFVARDGRAVRRVVRIGERSGLEAQVVAGLAEGEEVVLFPSDLVRDGVRVDTRRR